MVLNVLFSAQSLVLLGQKVVLMTYANAKGDICHLTVVTVMALRIE